MHPSALFACENRCRDAAVNNLQAPASNEPLTAAHPRWTLLNRIGIGIGPGIGLGIVIGCFKCPRPLAGLLFFALRLGY